MPPATPTFRDLSARETIALLRHNHVGRVAFAIRNVVTIEPIHYVYAAGWIYCRTSPGMKVRAIARSPWVSFEVDEIRGPFDWKSVVVRGTAYVFGSRDDDEYRAAFRRGVAALRKFIPETLHADDPTPERQLIFGIYVHEARGRQAVPRAKAGRRPAPPSRREARRQRKVNRRRE